MKVKDPGLLIGRGRFRAMLKTLAFTKPGVIGLRGGFVVVHMCKYTTSADMLRFPHTMWLCSQIERWAGGQQWKAAHVLPQWVYRPMWRLCRILHRKKKKQQVRRLTCRRRGGVTPLLLMSFETKRLHCAESPVLSCVVLHLQPKLSLGTSLVSTRLLWRCRQMFSSNFTGKLCIYFFFILFFF